MMDENDNVEDSSLSDRLANLKFPADKIREDVVLEEYVEDLTEFELQRRVNAEHNLLESTILKQPLDVLVLILKYVATKDLDMKSVENFGEVCSHFYVLARDPALWHLVCQAVWGKHVQMYPFMSWRSAYLDKPHVWVNGIYISRTSYVRTGDSSAMSQCYRPYFLVEYCRYLRFFSNGTVFMLTTANDPVKIVQKFANPKLKMQGLMVGKYNIHNEKKTKRYRTTTVSAVLYPSKNLKDTHGMQYPKNMPSKNPSESKYNLELEVMSTSNAKHFNKLVWLKHTCTTTYKNTGKESSILFNVSQQYPPLYFSAVKGYTNNSVNSL